MITWRSQIENRRVELLLARPLKYYGMAVTVRAPNQSQAQRCPKQNHEKDENVNNLMALEGEPQSTS